MKKTFILFCFILGQTAAFAQGVPAYMPWGMIAWFPFTGNAIDSTGHGHNGTVSGATLTTDRYGHANSAYYFNGTSDYIYVPPGTPGADVSTDIVASLTISAWVKSTNYSYTSQEQIYWRGDATPAHDPHMLYIVGSEVKIRRDVNPGTTVNEVGTSVAALDTNFHMLTGTYDSISGVMKVYIDGQLRNSAVLPGLETYPTSTMYNYIGAVDGGTWQFFYGTMDELGIWNRALTECEVAALYYSVPNVITSQPANDTVVVGGTAVFSITDLVPGTTYQWQENSGTGFVNLASTPPYSGVTTATLTITSATATLSGRHYRCVPVSGTCLTDTSAAAKLVVQIPSGIADLTGKTDPNIVPNPNNGSFTITGSVAGNSTVSVEITDLIGQAVYTQNIKPQSGEVNEHIVLDKVASGIYILKIRSGNENKMLRLLIGN